MTITLTKAAPEARLDLRGYYLNTLRNSYEVQSEQRKAELIQVWEKSVRNDNLRKLRNISTSKSTAQHVQDGIAAFFNMFVNIERQESQEPEKSLLSIFDCSTTPQLSWSR